MRPPDRPTAHADRLGRATVATTLRALTQRDEVDAKEVRIMGSKSVLLRIPWRKYTKST